ncbi:hypothetical protein GH714_034536 [Hevea brasiliensis]|uniref:Peptidase S8/S53 domain-containing protein n=1 Tax=Hevea brasiliensis TaxID=3981 RepID=A0A6A6LT37_HEVBR|nr:hypothetical protein GH714_034536 [Hevea brasiliensis]
MEGIHWVHLVVVLCLGLFVGILCENDSDSAIAAVYIVTLKQAPAAHYYGELRRETNVFKHGSPDRRNKLHRPRNNSSSHWNSGSYIAQVHDLLLRRADKLSRRREVANVVLDFSVRTATTHTPQFLGLPLGAWVREGGYETAGEGIVIGFIDTGIDPTHPSFADDVSDNSYQVPRHFSASAITRGIFNSTQDYASPFDGDGHGTKPWIPVIVAGHHFGNASGMAPRSLIAVYKALYKGFGGFAADIVAAIDQAAQDGVDIISLSITPNRRPPAGNTGPSPKSMFSFSPWIFTVGATSHDRVYTNSIMLGNNVTIPGVGLARTQNNICFSAGMGNDTMYTLISALHALNNETTVADDMYLGECQDSNNFNQDLVQGNLLICSYSIRFVLGLSTIKQSLQTAKNLSAAGVVFYMDPSVIGFRLNPIPMRISGIIIPSPDDSKVKLVSYAFS